MPRGDDTNVGQKPDGTETQLQLDALNNLKVTLAGAAASMDVNVKEIDGNTPDLGTGNVGAGTQRMTIADDDTNLSAILAAILALVPLPETTHKTPADGSATYTSSNTFTLVGLPFTITNNAQIVYAKQILADDTSKVWRNGVNCTLKQVGGVVTIYGAGTPFVAADEYAVGINDQDKGYDSGQDAHKFLEQSPEKDWYTDAVPLVTEQDLTATEDDLGSPIDVRGKKTLVLYIAADCNDSQDVDLSAYSLDESGGDEYISQDVGFTSEVKLWSGAGTDFFHEYRMDVNGHSFIQLKGIAGTVGATAGDLTIKIGKRY